MTLVMTSSDPSWKSEVGTSKAWSNPNFRRLWAGSAISWFGSEIGELALPLLAIVTLSASAGEVGLLRTVQFLPFLVATLPLGVYVDRRRRRPLMIAADIGRFVLVGAIPVAVWLGAGIEFLYITVFVAGILTVLYQLADFSFVPTVVPRHQLIDANGKLSAVHSANEIAGKGVGGVIAGVFTAPFAVLIDAATYLVSAFSLSRISVDEAGPRDFEHRSALPDAFNGIRLTLCNRFVRPLLGEATTFNFFNEIFIIGLLLYTTREVHLGPEAIGLMFAAGGLGSFLGAWFGSRVTRRYGYGRVLLLTLALGNTAPVGSLLTNTSSGFTLALLSTVFFVMGIGMGVANVHVVSLRQTAIPEQLRARINAAYRLISWGAIPTGAAVGGMLAGALGSREAMAVGALGIPLATVWVALSPVPKLATIDDPEIVGEAACG